MDTCEVHFIDCMGYWDLASEILSLALIAFITLRTLKNIINLNLARRNESNSEVKKSLIRKIIVNSLSLVY
jgi:hypothetical protein